MSYLDCAQFEKYVRAFGGSRFAAINYVANVARRRRHSVHNCITESQALTWVISGVEPDDIQIYKERMKNLKQLEIQYVDDRLCYIEEADIREAVRASIEESRQVDHLIYLYNNIVNTAKQARVRILCNMIWDELRQFKLDNKV